MVMINRLSVKGFKSFANKTELIFGNKFNIIIGANGSGKTNISDSVCFVLGKSSAKEMRAEKSASLIYNGGKKGSPAKEAEVSLIFDNSSNKFPIQSKEVEITRIVRQNGVSIYKINDETRTRQQVLELLSAAKLDPDGHNIIMQGDIVALAEMKPVERRAIIEEIAGISIYEDKKQKCLNELQKVDVKLNEAEIILTEREANLRELKKERDQAIKYKEIKESIRDDKGTFLHIQIKEKEGKLEEIEKRKKEAEEKIQKSNNDIDELKKEIQSNKNQIKSITEEVEVKGEKDQFVLRKSIEEIKTNIVKASSRFEVCQNEIEKIKTRKQQLNSNIKEVEEKIKELKSKKQEQEQIIKKIISEEKETQSKIYNFKEKHGFDTSLNQTLETIDKNIDKALENINKINQEKQELIRTKDQFLFKLKAAEERINSLKASGKDLEILKENKKKSKEITDKLNKNISENTSYSLQINNSRSEFHKISEELAKHKSRQISIHEKSLSDLAVKKLLELKNNIKGIHGTAVSLGDVESKYSMALEVAIGARATSLVVDSDTTAQKCIEYLKENKLGIATFLPLNKIKERVVDSSIKAILSQKGIQGLASDILKYDSKYKNVFSYLLGSTLVVEDILTARKIGIGKARMVTLEGDLIEPSGAMVGGFRIKREGLGFREKDIEEKVVSLEEELKKIKTLIDHIEKKKIENENSIVKLREEKANTEAEILKLERTLDLEGSSNLLEEKKELQEKIKEEDKKIVSIEDKIKAATKDLSDLKVKKSKVKEKLADPEIARDLESLEENRLKIKEKSVELTAAIKNIDTQIEAILLPEKERTEKIIKQQDKEFEEFSKELVSVKDLIKVKNDELKEKEKEEKEFYSNFKDLINKRNKLNEKMQKLDTDVAREEEKLKAFEQKLNNISIDRAKAVAELEALQKEFEEFKDAKIKRGVSLDELKLRIKENERALNSIGNVNLRALEVYEQIHEEYGKIIEKVEKLKREKEDVLSMMAEIESKKAEVFMKTYNNFIKNFKSIFNQLTTKGEAHVLLENEENPFEGGVDIQVRVAGNKFLDMRSLSGGEKTLAALAFIFAIQEYSPSPFYLLDEVDAALDKRNSELLSKLIQKYSEKAQYIVISHNDNIITEAENIYGVSMKEGVSKVVSLKV